MIKIFFAFLVKETYHILRDTRTLIILFGMPITLLLIFGYTVSNEFRGASLSIYDQSKDQLSIGLVQHIVSSGHFKLVQNASSKADFEQSFKSNEVKIGIVIPAKFEQDFYKNSNTNIQIITDASEPNYASTLTNYATQIIKAYQLKHWAIKEAPYQIDIKTRMYYNPKLIGAYNFVPGVVALILMLTSAMMTSLTIAREKETGTMDLLLASPLPPLIIILGKVTPYTILSFLSAVMVFAMGHYLFAVPILGSITLLFSLSLLYLLVALALGVLISTKSPNQQTGDDDFYVCFIVTYYAFVGIYFSCSEYA